MGRSFSIIVVDDEQDDAEDGARKLRTLGFNADARRPAELQERLKEGPVDAVVAHVPVGRVETA
ncbi:MAG: hypothetical protein ACOC05_08375, partial [Oceanicaulis sp.]